MTNEQLITEVQNSLLDEGQKAELIKYIPEMNDEEKQDLITLIEDAKKAGGNNDEAIASINREYMQKIDQVAKEEEKFARVEFEKFDDQQVANEMKTVEGEIIANAKSANVVIPSAVEGSKHGLLKFLFFLLLLILLIAGAIYGLIAMEVINI